MKTRILAGLILTFAAAGPGLAETFTYDALGRIVGIAYPTGTTLSFEWDSNGNSTVYTVTNEGGEGEGEGETDLDVVADALLNDFAALDVDLDDALTLAEARAGEPELTQLEFDALDLDGDGVLTALELEDYMGGEGEVEPGMHSADQDGDSAINLSELLRVIQFFNSAGLHCDDGTEDGYAPGDGDLICFPHAADYNPQDWEINLSELLRLIQFFNLAGYYPCPDALPLTEDGFCPGIPG
jgi:YD repeat-containing protein